MCGSDMVIEIGGNIDPRWIICINKKLIKKEQKKERIILRGRI